MTTILKHEEVIKDGRTIVVEKYQDKEMRVPMWRYYQVEDGCGYDVHDMLASKPNVKRLSI